MRSKQFKCSQDPTLTRTFNLTSVHFINKELKRSGPPTFPEIFEAWKLYFVIHTRFTPHHHRVLTIETWRVWPELKCWPVINPCKETPLCWGIENKTGHYNSLILRRLRLRERSASNCERERESASVRCRKCLGVSGSQWISPLSPLTEPQPWPESYRSRPLSSEHMMIQDTQPRPGPSHRAQTGCLMRIKCVQKRWEELGWE